MPSRFPSLLVAAIAACATVTLAQEKPAPPKKLPAIPWDAMDLGPFFSGTFKVKNQVVAKGIAVKVGTAEAPATVLFDPEMLRVSAAWTGGFITFPRGRGGLEGQIAPEGEVKLTTDYTPGWSRGDIGDDPRPKHQGNLPGIKWHGLYVHGTRVVLSYAIGNQSVWELPGTVQVKNQHAFTRTIAVGPGAEPLTVLLGEGAAPGGGHYKAETADTATVSTARIENGQGIALAAVSPLPAGAKVEVKGAQMLLKLPALKAGTTFQVTLWNGPASDEPERARFAAARPEDVLALTKGGPARWGQPLETAGKLGAGDGAYVFDEITLPDPNPFNTWWRPGGHDFFPNGDAALVNLSGDVWIVSGLDASLAKVKWKRFATGLFQPLGCKVVDGKIYVTGRDQITRLHDLNGDGEADFYESFNNGCVVTDNYHEFALDLQTDSAGNFYFAKGSPWTPTNTSPHQGTLLRVSKDGAKLEVFATGLRAPNGLSMGPKDFLTCSDNQGHWMPANRINIIKHGGFYGMVPAAHKTLKFRAADGSEFEANPSSEEDRQKFKTEFWGKADTPTPVAGYDLPLLWMPQNVDNSPGGEVWVTGGKWGPWEGRMLHLSYGHCLLYGVAMETVDGVAQGAVIKFPFKFPSGVQRGRFHPKDGQLYVSGLNVWQSDASKFGCFSRVRYTGKTVTMPLEVHAKRDGVELKFSAPLDAISAGDKENYNIERWNYAWTGNYGSPDLKISPANEKGKETMTIESASVSADRKAVFLKLAGMAPCMQMRIKYKIQSADGSDVDYEIHNTIHRVPGMKVAVP
jgi:glucose/arabinose dehydrogenase